MTETMAMVAIREAVEVLKVSGLQTCEGYTVKGDSHFFATVYVSSEGDPQTDETSSCLMCCGLRDVERFVKMLTKLGGTL